LRCLIIAAGRGSRLAHRFPLKPLAPVAGIPLIERVMALAAGQGVRDFVVVAGYRRRDLERFVTATALRLNVNATIVANPRWRLANGHSVLAARRELPGEFILLMSDHLFDGGLLDVALSAAVAPGQAALVVDSRVAGHPHVDLDDVTRVQVCDGRIVAIGKGLAAYNAFDTGIFRCTPGLFAALAESMRRGDGSLSGGMRVLVERGDALALNGGGRFWIDVDDERAFALAEGFFAGRSQPPAR
jgi:1L-myo-inositol 1-phosphate cytidylyltransferase